MGLISTLLLSTIIGATMAKLQPGTFHIYRDGGTENYPFNCPYGQPFNYKGVQYFVNNEKVFENNTMLKTDKWKKLGIADIKIVKQKNVNVPILYISKDISKQDAKEMKFKCSVQKMNMIFGFGFLESEVCENSPSIGNENDEVILKHHVRMFIESEENSFVGGKWIIDLDNKNILSREISGPQNGESTEYKQNKTIKLKREMSGKKVVMKYTMENVQDSKSMVFAECTKQLDVQYLGDQVKLEPKLDLYKVHQIVRCHVDGNPKPRIYWKDDKTNEKISEGFELTFERRLFKEDIPEKPGDIKHVIKNYTCVAESDSNPKKVAKRISFKIVVDNIKDEDKEEAGNTQTAAIAAGVVICLIILVIVGAVVVYYCRKKAQTGAKKVPTEDDDMKHKNYSDRNNANA